MTQISTTMRGAFAILGSTGLVFETKTSVNALRSGDVAYNWTPANSGDLPLAQPDTGLSAQTRVATPTGERRIDALCAGDTVLDANGHPVKVRHILSAPHDRSAIRIRAPYFGLNQDMVVGANHRIAVRSDAAEYLFGSETVLVPVWALKDGRRAQHWQIGRDEKLFQVQLSCAAALKIGNCAVESMPKAGDTIGKALSESEARCFAAEFRHGIHS